MRFPFGIVHPSAQTSSVAVFSLNTMAFRNPREEMLQSRALAPKKAEELGCVEGVHVSAQKSFQPPANIRTGPGTQPVAFGGRPIVAKRGEDHPLLPTFASSKRSNVRDVVAAMPGVKADHVVEGHQPHFRMTYSARKILWPQRPQQDLPTVV